mmetsp:Transcript_40802/g.73051  ORF Transcript_40802/g.73051 Transcript_40802/m.73051 type:complete len:215 (-) Transcript_40802:177-821(-)
MPDPLGGRRISSTSGIRCGLPSTGGSPSLGPGDPFGADRSIEEGIGEGHGGEGDAHRAERRIRTLCDGRVALHRLQKRRRGLPQRLKRRAPHRPGGVNGQQIVCKMFDLPHCQGHCEELVALVGGVEQRNGLQIARPIATWQAVGTAEGQHCHHILGLGPHCLPGKHLAKLRPRQWQDTASMGTVGAVLHDWAHHTAGHRGPDVQHDVHPTKGL